MKVPPDSPEYAKFTEGLKEIHSVPKGELQRRIDAEKKEKVV